MALLSKTKPALAGKTAGTTAVKVAPRKAAGSDISKFALEVKGASRASYIYGRVTEVAQGYQIAVKRRQSPKIDTFILDKDDVLVAQTGDEGYLLTGHPDFVTYDINFVLTGAEFTDNYITGTDPKGHAITIDRTVVDATRYVSWAE